VVVLGWVLGIQIGVLAAQEEAVGKALLSDGKVVAGEMEVAGAGWIGIYAPKIKKRFRLRLEEIARLDTTVEKEVMQQGWMFEEEGSPKKIKLPFFYPIRKYRTRVALKGGQVIDGHLDATVIHVHPEDEDAAEERLFLLTNHEGKKGGKLADLVYVRELIVGSGTAAKLTPLCTLKGRLPGAREVRAVSLERGTSHPGHARPDGTITVPNLVAGRYAVVVKTERALVVGWAPGPPPAGKDLETLEGKVRSVAEFFDVKRIRLIRTEGHRFADVFLEMRRSGGTTLREKGRSYRFIRWELWRLENLGTEWAITARAFLFRRPLPPGVPFPELRVIPRPELGRIEVTGETVNLPEVKQ
jgi:hypothetical protein